MISALLREFLHNTYYNIHKHGKFHHSFKCARYKNSKLLSQATLLTSSGVRCPYNIACLYSVTGRWILSYDQLKPYLFSMNTYQTSYQPVRRLSYKYISLSSHYTFLYPLFAFLRIRRRRTWIPAALRGRWWAALAGWAGKSSTLGHSSPPRGHSPLLPSIPLAPPLLFSPRGWVYKER